MGLFLFIFINFVYYYCFFLLIILLYHNDVFIFPEKDRKMIINKISRNMEISVKEEFEDTKGVIRIRISKKERQYNGQKKKYKRTNNELQNIHIKLKIE